MATTACLFFVVVAPDSGAVGGVVGGVDFNGEFSFTSMNLPEQSGLFTQSKAKMLAFGSLLL